MKKRDSGRGNRVGLSSLGFTTVLIVLLALLVFSILASITFGNADLSVKEVYSVVAYELFHIRKFSDFAEGAVHDVVWIIRFPRVILALCVGMGLAVCGVVMQAVVKNPLADPYVLGISSGASLGATIGVLFGFGALFGANSVGVMAFLGAMGTSFLVLFIANIGGRSNAGKLILAEPVAVDLYCAGGSCPEAIQAKAILCNQQTPKWLSKVGDAPVYYDAETPTAVVRPGKSVVYEEVQPLAVQ